MEKSSSRKCGEEIKRDSYLSRAVGEEMYKDFLKGGLQEQITITSKDGTKTYKLTDITP